MRELLSAEVYVAAKEKLANIKVRLAAIEAANDLSPERMDGVRRSYEMMIRKFQDAIAQYEQHLNRTTASIIK